MENRILERVTQRGQLYKKAGVGAWQPWWARAAVLWLTESARAASLPILVAVLEEARRLSDENPQGDR
jgi:hypothetical protein